MARTRHDATGVAWYVGIPGAGKTTLAATHLAQDAAANRWPCIIVDSSDVAQLAHVPHVASLRELEHAVWSRGEHAALIPGGPEEVEELAALVLRRGRVNLLVDEAAFWLNARQGTSGSLVRLMRAHRHAKARLYLTTQHLSADVPQAALSCAPILYVFRCTSPVVLERLEREFGLDPSTVRALNRGWYIRHETGFSS